MYIVQKPPNILKAMKENGEEIVSDSIKNKTHNIKDIIWVDIIGVDV